MQRDPRSPRHVNALREGGDRHFRPRPAEQIDRGHRFDLFKSLWQYHENRGHGGRDDSKSVSVQILACGLPSASRQPAFA
jgi:hypothetical protein